jgi:uncharacterized protein
MQYRKFGSLDWEVSALGFGAMRFPVLDDDPARIDEEKATAMIRHAIDSGVNYVDTAYGYHQEQSEPFVGKALKDGYRERVKLATKMPSWLVKEVADFDRLLEEQMTRLDVNHLDFYLLHALSAKSWKNYQELDVFTWAEKRMTEGLFDHLCFSFHDEYPVFESIVNGYDNWTMAQIQYNYVDEDYQAGRKGMELAAERGMAVVVMEPLRGGRIAKNPPPDGVADVWAKSQRDWTPAAWALHWVWNQPEIATALSGMSTMEQVEENLVLADQSTVGILSPEELALYQEVCQVYNSLMPIPCTQCEYCLPCPSDVAIPRVFETYNDGEAYDAWERSRFVYREFFKPENRADRCVECGECEEACPQNIKIIEWLARAHERLAEPAR